MTVNDLTLKFITSPSNLEMGAGKLAARFKCSKEDIYKAKIEARRLLYAAELAEVHDVIKTQEDQLARYIGSESTPDGTIRKYESTRPLSPKEIETLVGADGVMTTVARVWDKMLPNGRWTYSIDLRFRVRDFYTTSELKDKLKELMPSISPFKIRRNPATTEDQALVILISDDHVGMINTLNVFPHPEMDYKERLLTVFDEVMMMGKRFEEIHVVSLGDQMNGWNSQTTRGGHEVKSKSNKDQFDEYVAGRIAFYDALFQSGVSDNYYLHDVENSNHSGKGFSYMANKCLEYYIAGRYPDVFRKSYLDTIGYFEYGNHVIMIGHGKDEKFQTRPMPAILDPKTDLYLYDYASSQRFSPADSPITFYKGDLHQHGIQMGRFGRYVNVPSLAGPSDFGEVNFGNTKGGALLEILDKTSYRISSQAIWFL